MLVHGNSDYANMPLCYVICSLPLLSFHGSLSNLSFCFDFQFYGYLSQQQNMMQDYIRTGTYQRAILANLPDFKDKVILDVGAGSGILSFFAIQAGARKVYAVEASTMAQHAEVSLHLISVSVQLHFDISSHTHAHTLVCMRVCVCVCVCVSG